MSFVQETPTAKTSQSSAEITIPFLFKKFPPFRNNLLKLRQLMTTKAVVAGQAHRTKPKLCVASGMLYVNVRRLVSFFAEEEKPVSTNSQHRRHEDSVPREVRSAKEVHAAPSPCAALVVRKPPAMPQSIP